MDSSASGASESGSLYISHLFRNVGNTADLRRRIFNENLPIVLLQPKLIVDDFQIQMAIFKAQHNLKEKRMKTKTLQTEIIYCLSPSKNITESLKLFSATDEDVDLLIVAQNASFELYIQKDIKGTQVDYNQLHELTDVSNIMDLYQITKEELTKSTMVDSVVSRMAAKDYYSVSSSA